MYKKNQTSIEQIFLGYKSGSQMLPSQCGFLAMRPHLLQRISLIKMEAAFRG